MYCHGSRAGRCDELSTSGHKQLATIMSVLAQLVARASAVATAMTPAQAEVTIAFLADTVGCAVSGLGHPYTAALRALQVGEEGSLRARIFAEATLAHVDEFDPIHPASAVLPCACVVAPALAVAADRGRSGTALLQAVLAGAEVAVEAGLRFGGPRLYAKRWWPTALFGGLGAALACARLMELDEKATLAALSISANGVGGLLSADELGGGHYALVGRAAADGYQAARAAAAGWTASQTLLDAPASAAVVAAAPPSPEGVPHLLSAALKPYPCARPLHAVIAAATRLPDVGGAGTTRIGLPAAALQFVTAQREPNGPTEAAASAVVALAATAAGRADDPAFYRNPSGLGGVGVVELYAATELDAAFPARWGAIVEAPSGDRVVAEDAPATTKLLSDVAARRGRFLRLTRGQWSPALARRWFDDGLDLHGVSHIRGWNDCRPFLR
jgi:2-methylcitrate dehydratase PrpD